MQGNLQAVLSLDASPEYMHSYKRWMKLAQDEPPVPSVLPDPDDLLVLIYTSGTTGTKVTFSYLLEPNINSMMGSSCIHIYSLHDSNNMHKIR